MMYTIKNNMLEVTISLHGAELKSIKYLGVERLHDSNPTFWNRSAPILFPIVGKLKDGKTIINGKSYAMKGHGFLRDVDFSLKELSEDSITLMFKANDETKLLYPYDFTVIIKYNLLNSQVNSIINITNDSLDVMPFNLGLHPAFHLPISNEYQYEDYQIVFPSPLSSPIGNVNLSVGTIDFLSTPKSCHDLKVLPLNHEDYKEDALVFDHFPFDQLTLVNKQKKEGVTFSFTGFTMLGIWSPYPVKAPFICLEPWCGCADTTEDDGHLINKRYIIKLEPNNHHQFTYSFDFF